MDHLLFPFWGPLTAPQQVATVAIAPRMLGWLICTVLYGITIPVFFNYLHSPAYQKDSVALRRLICVVMFLLTLQTIVNWVEIMIQGVIQLRSTDDMSRWNLADCFAPICHAMIGALVQAYLSRRCYLLCAGLHMDMRLPIKCLVIGLFGSLVITAFAGAIALTALGAIDFATGNASGVHVAFALHMASSTIIDCLVSGTLIWSLRGQSSRFNEHLIRRIVRMAMTTAAYTAVVALIGTVLALTVGANADSPYSSLYMPFAYVLPALYTCSLFSTTALRHEYHPPSMFRSSSSATLNVGGPGLPLHHEFEMDPRKIVRT